MTTFHFKPVDAKSSTWKFGFSDHTLVVLAASLLDDERLRSVPSLADAMTLDPEFVLWAATALAWQNAGSDAVHVVHTVHTVHTIRELAERVTPLLDRLTHDLVRDAFPRSCGDTSEALRTLVRAEVARFLLTSSPPSPAADPVYLAAILDTAHDASVSHDDVSPGESKVGMLHIPLTDSEKNAVEASGRLVQLQNDRLPQKIDDLDERLLGVDLQLGSAWIDQRRQHLEQRLPAAETLLEKLVGRLERVLQLETSFQETLEREKLEAMAEFAAGAGHEINNPLAVIAGRAQLMLQDEADPERARGLALINAQAKRVYEMIADMRLFARPPEPVFEQIDLVSLLDELIDEMTETAETHAITLRRSDVQHEIVLDADPTQLMVLFRAMVQNSIEAIGDGGTIELAPDEEGNEITVRITDDGPGIPDEVRRHLFDPYYSGRQAGRGLGLGLSKAWRIVVTNHGGTITVDSTAHGTVFTIRLPKRQGKFEV